MINWTVIRLQNQIRLNNFLHKFKTKIIIVYENINKSIAQQQFNKFITSRQSPLARKIEDPILCKKNEKKIEEKHLNLSNNSTQYLMRKVLADCFQCPTILRADKTVLPLQWQLSWTLPSNYSSGSTLNRWEERGVIIHPDPIKMKILSVRVS